MTKIRWIAKAIRFRDPTTEERHEDLHGQEDDNDENHEDLNIGATGMEFSPQRITQSTKD